MKVYLRVANVRISRFGCEERFSLVEEEDIEEDRKANQEGAEVRYFELKEVEK